MSFTELTEDDKHLTLDDLRRLSMVEVDPGVWAQRYVMVEAGSGSGGDDAEGFDYEFDLGLN
jgi:hypothetical protein